MLLSAKNGSDLCFLYASAVHHTWVPVSREGGIVLLLKKSVPVLELHTMTSAHQIPVQIFRENLSPSLRTQTVVMQDFLGQMSQARHKLRFHQG